MKRINKKFLALLVLVLAVILFPAVSLADVSFSDGQYVKLGYMTTTPPVWEVKALPGAGTGKTLFFGVALSTGSSYGNTSEWANSSVRQYLETYLTAHFSSNELATGVLTPYGDSPIYDVAIPDTAFAVLAAKTKAAVGMNPDVIATGVTIPPSSAGDSLVWILDVQEIQAIYNNLPDLPWNETAGYSARLNYAAGGPYRTRSVDPSDPSVIWTINTDGSFVKDSVTASPSYVCPVVSPDASVMLYKRGWGTQSDPYGVCYRWDISPAVSVKAGTNTITLTFPEAVSNNGVWPGAEAWKITDDLGTTYSVTGTSGAGIGKNVTLTVFPALRKIAALTLEYAQTFDDASQGLNNTKGAILRNSSSSASLLFGLPDMTLTVAITGDSDCECEQSGDPNDGNCTCNEGSGACKCGAAGCDRSNGLRILSDSVYYLVLGQPFILDLEADGGVAPYGWNTQNGALPDGLALSEEGVVEGATTVAGSFRVTIEVTDSDGKTASKKFSFIVVEDEELVIMTDALPDAQAGQPYTTKVRGSGGTKPYTWEIENLPDWLLFDAASGILSGTPAESGIHELLIRIHDGENATDTKLLRLSVWPHDGLLIATRVLPAAVYGEDYSAQLEASGGIPPYFFTPRRGFSLPPGLVLDNAGALSGRPSQKGVHNFVIDAMDGNNLQGSILYTMVVLDGNALNLDAGNFTVSENEEEKRIQMSFYLPKDFNDAEVVAIDALVSPDTPIAGSGSAVTKETNGDYKVELTLYASEQALNNSGVTWRTLTDSFSVEGLVVLFRDASGESIRFGKALPLEEIKHEAGDDESWDDGGGGCSAGWGAPLAFPLLVALMKKRKRQH